MNVPDTCVTVSQTDHPKYPSPSHPHPLAVELSLNSMVFSFDNLTIYPRIERLCSIKFVPVIHPSLTDAPIAHPCLSFLRFNIFLALSWRYTSVEPTLAALTAHPYLLVLIPSQCLVRSRLRLDRLVYIQAPYHATLHS